MATKQKLKVVRTQRTHELFITQFVNFPKQETVPTLCILQTAPLREKEGGRVGVGVESHRDRQRAYIIVSC